MSAQLKPVPRTPPRLQVKARFEHETILFEGNLFQFVEHLVREGWTGEGTFVLNQGTVMTMKFDLRSKKPIDNTGT